MKKKIWIILFAIGMFFILSQNASYAGYQTLNSLNYYVELNSDGSMDVEEIWNIYVRETNTLFKNFDIGENDEVKITNVSVTDIETNLELNKINEEMYHVTKDCFYALPIEADKFEIAWGIGMDNSYGSKKYKISYTVENAVTVYEDCSELYWMFLSKSNGIPAKRVTGTVKLPESVTDIENLRIWAHGPLNGEITKRANDEVFFTVEDFEAETMLEVRIVVEEPIFKECTNISEESNLNAILKQEKRWANLANYKRIAAQGVVGVVKLIWGFIFIVISGYGVKCIVKYLKKYKKLGKEKKNNKHVEVGKYFRDIPREEDATPAQAALLYYSKNKKVEFTGHESEVLSATILQLCLKGQITLKQKENETYIYINEVKNLTLKNDENVVLDILKEVAGSSNELTMEQLKEYASTEYDNFAKYMARLKEKAEKEYSKTGRFSAKKNDELEEMKTKRVVCIFGCIFLPILVFCTTQSMHIINLIIFELLSGIVLLSGIIWRMQTLTEEGKIERKQWKALKNYMEDFSLLEEKEIPDLILWEKYLVYATMFGISDKVIKQLEMVYPQFDSMDSEDYKYMHLMSVSNSGNMFMSDFNKNVDSVYKSYKSAYNSAYSSGSGGDGGFSSGGGGRKRWRPEWAEDKKRRLKNEKENTDNSIIYSYVFYIKSKCILCRISKMEQS